MNPASLTVAILCGGKATRLHPLTKEIPKALVDVGGLPVVERLIRHGQRHGLRRFVLCEGVHAEALQRRLGDGSRLGVEITHVVEPEPLGTAGALARAAAHLSDPFFAMQGDLVLETDLTEMLAFQERQHADATLLSQPGTHPFDSDLHELGEDWRVLRLFRPVAGDRFLNVANAGVFLLPLSFLEGYRGRGSIECDLLVPRLATHRILSCFRTDYLQDMGTPERLDEVAAHVAREGSSRATVFLDHVALVGSREGSRAHLWGRELSPEAAAAIRSFNEAGVAVLLVTDPEAGPNPGDSPARALLRYDHLRRLLLGDGAWLDEIVIGPQEPRSPENGGDRKLDAVDPSPSDGGERRLARLRAVVRNRPVLPSRSVLIASGSPLLSGGAASGRTVLVQAGPTGPDGGEEAMPPAGMADLLSAARSALPYLRTGSRLFLGRAFVTGGAGFIGSHLVDRLLREGAEVTVYDNFSTGQEAFLVHHAGDPRLRIVRADILDRPRLSETMAGHDFVFHLAANADVRGGMARPRVDLEQNTIGTWNVLEAMRENGVSRLMFASSAAVYGEPDTFPTPESHAPVQTSLYGASKLAGEAMIQAYGEYHGLQSWIFRFVSWIGERYTHGVIFDFLRKLAEDPEELEILGDGEQRKSYLDVADGVEAIFFAIGHARERSNLFNLGHDDWMSVCDLADVVCSELGLAGVRYRTTGGDRGWRGDAPFVHLDTARLKGLGWAPRIPIEEGIRRTVRYLRAHPEVLDYRHRSGG